MKKKLSSLLFALACIVACEQPAGTGGPAPSVTVNSAADLAKIGKDSGYPLNGKYTLGSDLALADWTPVGTSSAPFAGTFNGNNKTLAITGSGGLFGFTDGAYITNLAVTGTIHASGSGTVFVGGVVGRGDNTAIVSCVSTADIAVEGQDHNSSAGGIAGFMSSYSTITDCRASGDISLKSGAGKGLMLYGGGVAGYQGLAGSSSEGFSGCVIERCSFTKGSVTVEGGYPYAGGVVGYNYVGSVLRESYAAEGSVVARGENIPYAGGLAGYNSRNAANPSRIENCYSDITVNADSTSQVAQAGGIVAANAADAAIFKCYARGAVAAAVAGTGGDEIGGSLGVKLGSNAGGIAGAQYFDAPTLQHCVALNTSITGSGSDSYNVHRIAGPGHPNAAQSTWIGNIAGAPLFEGERSVEPDPSDTKADGYDGETCAAKPAQSAYEALGWDFASVWTMGSGGYPVLRWQ